MNEKKIRAFYESRPDASEEIRISRGHRIDFPPHFHDELELFWVQEGSVRVMVGSQWRELTAGQLAVVFPNTIHAYQCGDAENLHTMVICQPSLLGESYSRLQHRAPAEPFLADLHEDITYAMEGLYRQRQNRPDRDMYRAYMRLIVARLLAEMELTATPEMKSIDLTSRLVEYLSKNFLLPLSLEDVAKALGVSRYHVSHVFSGRLKTSFSDYLNFLRLNFACELLQTTGKSISEISLDAGFSSQRTFNRAFRDRFGLSPRQYRAGTKKEP